MERTSMRPEADSGDWLAAQVEGLFTRRAAAAAARAAEAEAVLAVRRQRLDHVLAALREVVSPVLEEVAIALRQRGFEATVAEEPDLPRVLLRVAEPNGTGHGPPRLAEGCLTFGASGDVGAVAVRQEAWRWRLGGSRQDCGTAALADVDRVWACRRTMEFVGLLILGQDWTDSAAADAHARTGPA